MNALCPLFERYRPASWPELVGQDKIVRRVSLLRTAADWPAAPIGYPVSRGPGKVGALSHTPAVAPPGA